jgi:hypothetical protein
VATLTSPERNASTVRTGGIATGAMMPLDWDVVARAFESANEELRWGAEVVVRPERRQVSIRYPRELRNHVARTTIDFHNAVAERIGLKEWMSLWVDFTVQEFRPSDVEAARW